MNFNSFVVKELKSGQTFSSMHASKYARLPPIVLLQSDGLCEVLSQNGQFSLIVVVLRPTPITNTIQFLSAPEMETKQKYNIFSGR